MIYIVLEIQANDETAATLVNSYTTRNQAISKYHQILAAAAISTVPMHSAVLLTDTGLLLKNESFNHTEEEEEEE